MSTKRLQPQASWSAQCSVYASQKLIIITLISFLCCCSWRIPQVVEAQDILGTGKFYAAGFNIAGPNKLDPRIKKDLDYNDPTTYFKENSLASFFNGRFTYDDYLVYAMRSVALVAGVDSDVHRYDHQRDLLNSFVRSPSKRAKSSSKASANNESILSADQIGLSIEDEDKFQQAKCGQHLDAVLRESQQLFSSQEAYSTSRQLSFIDYLDSFGWPKSQVMQGNHLFLGSHEQCSQANLTTALKSHDSVINNEDPLGTRYCVANYRSPNWPVVGPNEKIERIGAQASFKLGVCLPDSCNTVSVANHLSRVDSLVKLVRLNQVPYSGYQITNLFCLPDESSPLRQFSLSAKIFILLLSSWLTVVAYFSIIYEYQRMKWIQTHGNPNEFLTLDASSSMKIFALRLSWSKLFEGKSPEAFQSAAAAAITTNNGNQHQHIPLPGTKRRSNTIDASRNLTNSDNAEELRQRVVPDLLPGSGASPVRSCLDCSPLLDLSSFTTASPTQQASTKEPVSRTGSNNRTSAKQSQSSARGVDLSIIDGLKVVSMVWLVFAHTMLIYIRTIANGREFWSLLKDPRYLTAMAGIFTVDTFFVATGVLTAFLKFNKNDGLAMGKTKYWLEAFIHRYLRLMPMYFLVFWYSRDVSEYTGVGPLWDYGTADTSLRSICKQESVTVPLLFRANFRSIDETCVKPAWYLANDYQFLLITPIFMALILKSKSLGYAVLIASTILSIMLQFLTVFYAGEWNDFQVFVNYKPMFGTYVLKNFWQLYVFPYNRIPPYLIGLLTGHLIYSLSKSYSAQRHLRQQQQDQKQDNGHHHGGSSRIRIIHSQDSLASSQVSSHREGASDIITKHSNRSYSPSSPSTNFINSLKSYLCFKVWAPSMILISLIYLPALVTKLEFNIEGLTAKIGTSGLISLMRLIWSLAIARLIYISSTRFLDINNYDKPYGDDSLVIRFLSSSIWKPWSKMGLTALLVQWEVIGYLVQIQTGLPNFTVDFLLSNALLSIVITYVLSLLLYLTVEYPLSQVERLYIHPMLFPKS